MLKRLFDILFSLTGLLLLSPFFLVVALWIVLDSGAPVFYMQERIGRNKKPFRLFKFRTMHAGADKKGLITVGGADSRITSAGYYLRKHKLDELPQLINVLKGDMSLVGPRPEVRKYVEMYSKEQEKVLSVRPGITDYASLEYIDENELLARAEDPGKKYVEEIMPAKLELNKKYIRDNSIGAYFRIIFKTIGKVMR